MTDAWSAGAETSVTIKSGKGYDDSWYVFRGRPEEIKAQLVDFFGIPSASVAGLSVFEVAVNCRQIAQGNESTVAALGGTIVPADTKPSQTTPGDDPWAAIEAGAPDESAPNPILGQIEACKTTDELKRLWAENQAAFADSAVMDAWKAKGKSLAGG